MVFNGELITEALSGHVSSLINSTTSTFIKFHNDVIMQKIVYDTTNCKENEIRIALPIAFPNHIWKASSFGLCDFRFYIRRMHNEYLIIDIRNFKDEKLHLVVVGC